MNTTLPSFSPDTQRTIAALHHVGQLWEARLAGGWTPPEGSTFPWAQVRLSLAALIPGLKNAEEWVQKVLGVGCWVLGDGEASIVAPSLAASTPNTQYPIPSTFPPTAALILAGNTPLLSWSPLCACLLAGWRVQVKMSREETLWPQLFWDSLHEADAEVAARIMLDVWPGDDARTAALVQNADAVIVFGSDRTIDAVRAQTPTETPFFGFGHAVSIGLLLTGCTWEEWRSFARDVLIYGQGGCLSPHILLESSHVNGDGTGIYGGKEFAEQMRQEADALEVPPLTDAAVARALREARDLAAFDGLEAIGYETGWEHLPYLVICDYPQTPDVLPVPVGHGTVFLVPGDSRELPLRLGPLRGRVSCVGIAGNLLDDVRQVLLAEGVSRICPAGQMQTPPLDWPNGNLDLLAELARIAAQRHD